MLGDRTYASIRAGRLPISATMLPRFLFPHDHVHNPSDIAKDIFRGHVMLRVPTISFVNVYATSFSFIFYPGGKTYLTRPYICIRRTWSPQRQARKRRYLWYNYIDTKSHSLYSNSSKLLSSTVLEISTHYLSLLFIRYGLPSARRPLGPLRMVVSATKTSIDISQNYLVTEMMIQPRLSLFIISECFPQPVQTFVAISHLYSLQPCFWSSGSS